MKTRIMTILFVTIMLMSIGIAECATDSDCDDSDPCTIDQCQNGSCYNGAITQCINNDSCCPEGCTNIADNDCSAGGGGGGGGCGVTEEPEVTCDDGLDNDCDGLIDMDDPDCTYYECETDADCDDQNACTEEQCQNGSCYYYTITECLSGDGCCPQGCTQANDDDCETGENADPIAVLEQVTACQIGMPCTFDGSDSYDPDGTIISYGVDLGDGGGFGTQGSPGTFNHSYSVAGPYTLTLSVTDDDNATGTTFLSMTVQENMTAEYDLRIEELSCPTSPAYTGKSYEVTANVYLEVTGTEETDAPVPYDIIFCHNGPTGGGCGAIIVINHEPNTYKTFTFNWVPTETGTHNITVEADSGEDIDETNENNNHAACNVEVEESVNNPPEITVVSPNGGEAWSGTQEITWKASDPDGTVVDHVNIYYCTQSSYAVTMTANYAGDVTASNAYGPCGIIAEGVPNTGGYKWDTTTVPNGAYTIKILVTDGELWGSDTSDGPFKVLNEEEPLNFDECNNGRGYSIGDEKYSNHPKYCHTGLKDCCGWYQIAHVHDLRNAIRGPADLQLTFKPGFYNDCSSTAIVSVSLDDQTWREIARIPVKSVDTDGVPGYPEIWRRYTHTVKGVTSFRYVKIEIPNCYNDYSSVKVDISGPTPCEPAYLDRPFKMHVKDCAKVVNYKSMKITVRGVNPSPLTAVSTAEIAPVRGTVTLQVEIPGGNDPTGTSAATTITLREGESKQVFGATIKALSVFDNGAALVVSVEGKEIKVWLDTPFRIREEQTARLMDYRVLTMKLDSIRLMPYLTGIQEAIGHDAPSIATARITSSSGEGNATGEAPSSGGGGAGSIAYPSISDGGGSGGGSAGSVSIEGNTYVAYITVMPTLERPTLVSPQIQRIEPIPLIATATIAVPVDKTAAEPTSNVMSITGNVVQAVVTGDPQPIEEMVESMVVSIVRPMKIFPDYMGVIREAEVEKLVEREEIKRSLGRKHRLTKGQSVVEFGVRITLKDINRDYATFVMTKAIPWKSCESECMSRGYDWGRCKAERCGADEVDMGTSYCPQLRVPSVRPMITAINMTRPTTRGYDKCAYGSGWSEPESAAKRCGWPPGKNGYIRDCCCCYTHTHVHDLGDIFANRDVEIEYKPGWSKGCTSMMNVYYSTNGEEWTRILEKEVTQETWSPKTIYTDRITIKDKFRYIKIYIPKCYNDYSSAWVVGEPKPDEEDIQPSPPQPPEEELVDMHCCCAKKTDDLVRMKIYKGWNLFSFPGQMSEINSLTNCDTKSWKVFEYIKETHSFEPVKYPEIGKAYWVYATTNCEVTGKIQVPTLLDEIEELTPKWNLVPVVPEMIGKTLSELSDCNLRAYTYDPPSHRWRRVTSISSTLYGRGLAVRTESSCKLGEGEIIPPIPPFPEEEEVN